MLRLIKRITIFVFAIFLVSSVSYSQDDSQTLGNHEKSTDEPVGIKMSDGTLYGKDYDPSMTMIEFAELISNPAENDGKMILVKGNVTEVCQAMGCWMTMSDGTNTARVKTGHNFLLPKDIAGSNAVVIGTFKVTEISEQDAKHYNDETKNPTVKTEDITGPQKAIEIEAIGIKILNPAEDPVKE